MAKKSNSSVTKNITLSEFKAWLQGVEDMQPNDWSPNVEQWTRIREKIDLIIESDIANQSNQRVKEQALPVRLNQSFAQPYRPVDNSALAGVATNAPPRINPENLKQGDRLLTPNLDTSDGQYNSMFS